MDIREIQEMIEEEEAFLNDKERVDYFLKNFTSISNLDDYNKISFVVNGATYPPVFNIGDGDSKTDNASHMVNVGTISNTFFPEEKTELPAFAMELVYSVYDLDSVTERTDSIVTLKRHLSNYVRDNFPKQYMVLLD